MEEKKQMLAKLKAQRDKLIDLFEGHLSPEEEKKYSVDLLFYKKTIKKLENELKAEL
jgi:uncharacterized protein YukE